jgi:hypothetical protein
MIDQAFLQAIYDLPLSGWIRENSNAFPFIESLHVLGIAMVFGTILVVDLRLLGVKSHRGSAKKLTEELLPFTWWAFVMTAITGVLMFITNAVSYAYNTAFLIKIGLIILAGLNMMWFHSTAYRKIAAWDLDMPPPAAARFAGFVSLIFWTTVIVLGRWIGFTLEFIV